jgi:hypothetical protein
MKRERYSKQIRVLAISPLFMVDHLGRHNDHLWFEHPSEDMLMMHPKKENVIDTIARCAVEVGRI